MDGVAENLTEDQGAVNRLRALSLRFRELFGIDPKLSDGHFEISQDGFHKIAAEICFAPLRQDYIIRGIAKLSRQIDLRNHLRRPKLSQSSAEDLFERS